MYCVNWASVWASLSQVVVRRENNVQKMLHQHSAQSFQNLYQTTFYQTTFSPSMYWACIKSVCMLVSPYLQVQAQGNRFGGWVGEVLSQSWWYSVPMASKPVSAGKQGCSPLDRAYVQCWYLTACWLKVWRPRYSEFRVSPAKIKFGWDATKFRQVRDASKSNFLRTRSKMYLATVREWTRDLRLERTVQPLHSSLP